MSDFAAKIQLTFSSNLDKVSKAVDKSTKKINKSFDKTGKKISKVSTKFKKFGDGIKKKLSGAFKGLTSGISKFGGKLGTIAGAGGPIAIATAAVIAIGAAAVFAGKKFFDFAKRTLASSDEIGKTAKSLGIGTNELQKFRLVAAKAGLSVGEADSSLKAMNTTMAKLEAFDPGTTLKFKQFGIDVRDTNGDLKTSTKLTEEMADALEEIKVGGKLSAAAIKDVESILGTSKIVNVLEGGAKAYKKAINSIKDEDLISKETIENATKLNDSIANLNTKFIKFGNSLAPMFKNLAKIVDKLAESKEISKSLEKILTSIVGLVEKLAPSADKSEKSFGLISSTLNGISNFIDNIVIAMEIWDNSINIISKFTKEIFGLFGDLWQLLKSSIAPLIDKFTKKFSEEIETVKIAFADIKKILSDLIPDSVKSVFKDMLVDLNKIWASIEKFTKSAGAKVLRSVFDVVGGKQDIAPAISGQEREAMKQRARGNQLRAQENVRRVGESATSTSGKVQTESDPKLLQKIDEQTAAIKASSSPINISLPRSPITSTLQYGGSVV